MVRRSLSTFLSGHFSRNIATCQMPCVWRNGTDCKSLYISKLYARCANYPLTGNSLASSASISDKGSAGAAAKAGSWRGGKSAGAKRDEGRAANAAESAINHLHHDCGHNGTEVNWPSGIWWYAWK